MVFVTDPDNLDRFQVAVDPLGERISIRGLGADRVAISVTGDSRGDNVLGDNSAGDLTTSGISAGDILSIISADTGGIIGHYTVSGTNITTTGIDVIGDITANSVGDNLTYKVSAAGTTGGTPEAAGDGVSLQACYSFLKEEWRTLSSGIGNAEDLIQFTFPLESITREQFEIGGPTHSDFDWYDDTTRNLLRTGGWQKKDSSGNVIQDYAGIITLGLLDSDTVVYYQQHAVTVDPLDFVLPGTVNQAINTFDEVTGPDDFAITNNNTITRSDGGNWYVDGYRPGGLITIRLAEDSGNIGSFTVVSGTNVVNGPLVVTAGALTNNANDTTMIAAVDKRSFLKLFARKKARSYVQSEIADIGVTTIETLVNRFPLTHAVDAAIVLDDGQLHGDPAAAQVVFQAVEAHSNATNGSTADNSDGTFNFTSAGISPAWNDGILQVGDTIEITAGLTTGDVGFYEIAAIVDADTITCFQEPTASEDMGTNSSVTFQVRTRTKDAGLANATLADVDSSTGTLTSLTATFGADDGLGDRTILAGDMVTVTADDDAVIGTYKVISQNTATELTLNTADQNFSGEANQTYIINRAGMHLQRKSVLATQVAQSDISFQNANPDTITRGTGNFTTDGYVAGMAVTVVGATNAGNNGTFIIDSVATTVLTLIASETLTAEGTGASVTLNGEVGFVRTLNNVDYPFNWRMFGNGGTLAQCFQWIQRELRRGRAGDTNTAISVDIDEAATTQRGDVGNLLMSFASPTGTTLNMTIDDIAVADLNNITQQDLSGDNRNNAFLAGLTITLNSNITDDVPSVGTNKIVVFFTDPNLTPADGDEFGSNGAIIVQDNNLANMEATDRSTTPLEFTFDYDNNAQGGRTPATDADITIVCIGQTSAQYVQTTGTILRQNSNTFALVAALERNFSNP